MLNRHIKRETQGGVAVITLADPGTLNALSLPMIEDLCSAFQSACTAARAIVLTGEGRGFCSGANLGADVVDPRSAGYDAGSALESHFNPLMQCIRHLPVPLVTAVNGVAAGAGCALALSGDLIVAAESSYFVQSFVRIGLVPDCGLTFMLVHAVGRVRALELTMLGHRLEASKALEWALVNRVVPDSAVRDHALTLATELAAGPTDALSMIRSLIWRAPELSYTEALAEERRSQARAGLSADHREGIEAFKSKRPPLFLGS